MSARFNRRQVLRCFGGALLALPTLEACSRPRSGEAIARAASRLSGPAAKRFVGVGIWNGVVPRLWYPQGGTETSFTLGAMLQDLAPHQANMIVLKGCETWPPRRPGAWTGTTRASRRS